MHNHIHRDISWLFFNSRVLDQVKREHSGVVERLRFMAIAYSNLDEFYEVRLGGLLAKIKQQQASGLLTEEYQQIEQMLTTGKNMVLAIAEKFTILQQELTASNIYFGDYLSLSASEKSSIRYMLQQTVRPLLLPTFYHPGHTQLQFIPSRTTLALCSLIDQETKQSQLAFVHCASEVWNKYLFIQTQSKRIQKIVPLREAIINEQYLAELFPQYSIQRVDFIRVTRNADIELDEYSTNSITSGMKDALEKRKTSELVRLEITQDLPDAIVKQLCDIFDITTMNIVALPRVYDFSVVFSFLDRLEALLIRKKSVWKPQQTLAVTAGKKIFQQIKQAPILLHHPYESFQPILDFISVAAMDPKVLIIKQVLYRTADNSMIIDALIKASRQGKQVVVLIEVKARFDEQHNLQRADELMAAGVQIVYGVKELKTHAKLTLIVRREQTGIRKYAHIGTGNYNEKTAKVYTDISYLTADYTICHDIATFFNMITGFSRNMQFEQLIPAPTHLKQRILWHIEQEIAAAKQGKKAIIMAKMNSLQHPVIVEALHKAALAGVIIKLNIRGICCFSPPEKAQNNVLITSIIDHYLEHARIFYFYQQGGEATYISSADWMQRNLDQRLEVMLPIEDKANKQRLISILKHAFLDNQSSYHLNAKGNWEYYQQPVGSTPFRFQEYMQKNAENIANKAKVNKKTAFDIYEQ